MSPFYLLKQKNVVFIYNCWTVKTVDIWQINL
jgi:hypothetical protein